MYIYSSLQAILNNLNEYINCEEHEIWSRCIIDKAGQYVLYNFTPNIFLTIFSSQGQFRYNLNSF